MTAPAVILDIDGTLVDTNYHHALAWHEAFVQHGFVLPVWRIHRSIGMGGDRLVPALIGDDADAEHGDAIRSAEAALYLAIIRSVQPLEGARDLVVDLTTDRRCVLASSAKAQEVEHYVDLLDARELVDGWTTAADVERTKPEPDLVRAAMEALGTDDAVMIGDTPWDVESARRAGVPTVAVLTGGFARSELEEAGAAVVFESVVELRRRIDETPLAG
ncbi:MAG: HAD family hydrolase [Solirubrobacteraceae bacterium]